METVQGWDACCLSPVTTTSRRSEALLTLRLATRLAAATATPVIWLFGAD